MLIHLDPIGGVAGDMFAAALLDAWPELETGLVAALDRAGIGKVATVGRRDHRDQAMRGSRFEVVPAAGAAREHRCHADIVGLLCAADLPVPVRERALDIFARLAAVEAEVHGGDPARVEFHEIGAWDSIADVVAAAWLIDALGDARWSCAPLPLGQGRVVGAHGELPVPAPATALLLAGMPVVGDRHVGERVTPTGAAIVAHLAPDFAPFAGAAALERCGVGFGARTFDGLSNVLRVLVLAEACARTEPVAVLTFEVDDQSAEDLAVALDNLRALPGVLDVVQSPVYGKKGRIMFQVQVLATPDARDRAIEACLGETTTLAVRWQMVERALLEREIDSVDAGGVRVRVKRARRPGGAVTRKAEIDDLRAAGADRAARERVRAAAEAEAGHDEDGGDER